VTKPPGEHAENWDLRHEDFNDNDYLYDVPPRQQKFRKVLPLSFLSTYVP